MWLPKTTKQYPKYMLAYWLVLWGISFLFSVVWMIPSISNNGYVVKVSHCEEYRPAGRFEESEECAIYGEPSYEPVGKILISKFKTNGIGWGIFVLLIGFFGWKDRRDREKEEKEMWALVKKLVLEGKINKDEAGGAVRAYLNDYINKHQLMDELGLTKIIQKDKPLEE